MFKSNLIRGVWRISQAWSRWSVTTERLGLVVRPGRAAIAGAALAALTGCTSGTYDCEGTELVIDGSRIEYAGADRYEVCQTNGNIMIIGFRDQCGTTSRNYMSFDKMQRKLARGTENWDCKKK